MRAFSTPSITKLCFSFKPIWLMSALPENTPEMSLHSWHAYGGDAGHLCGVDGLCHSDGHQEFLLGT